MGGVIGISQSPATLDCWFLTMHERASITTALKELYGLQDDGNSVHKEVTPRRVQRDEEDVKKMIGCFSSGLMTDPFTQDSDVLLNFTTGAVLPGDVAESLVSSTEKGREQMNNFVEKRLATSVISFWEPLRKLKIKTFSSTNKNISLKSNDKLVTVNADRDFVRTAANRFQRTPDQPQGSSMLRALSSSMFPGTSRRRFEENGKVCAVQSF